MRPEAALLVVRDGLGSSAWQGVVAAYGRSAPLGRLYVLFLAGTQLPDRSLLLLATRCFQAASGEARVAPRLDLVPLFATCGWSLELAARLGEVRFLLLEEAGASWETAHPAGGEEAGPSDCASDAAAWSDDALLARVAAARPAGAQPLRRLRLPACPLSPRAAAVGAPGAPVVSEEQLTALFPDDGRCFDHVAVGGTFDRLHGGHRLLLAVAAACCCGNLYLGVTGDALLSGKAHAQLLQSYEERLGCARAYLQALRPAPAPLRLDTSTLTAAPPKAATMEHIQALVLSRETAGGAAAVQAQRAARGFPPLRLLTVDLVGATSQAPLSRKLSSSGLREMEAAAEARERADRPSDGTTSRPPTAGRSSIDEDRHC